MFDFLIVLGRRKGLLAKSTLAVALISTIVCLLIPNRYTASITILPPQQNSSAGAALLAQMGNLGNIASLAGGGFGGLGFKNPDDLVVALLRSRTMEDAIIRRFGLMGRYREKRISDARKALERHCSIDSDLKDGLIKISFEDWDPKLAAEMANAYVEEYKKFSASLAITEASQRRLFFEEQLQQEEIKLADAEEAMKSAEQKSGMIQLDSQAKALIESVAKLKAEIGAQEVVIRSMGSYAGPDNPDLLRAKEQLSGLQNQLKALSGSQSGNDSDLIIPQAKLPQAGLEYVRRLRDVKYHEMVYQLLARQFEAAKIDEARQGSLVQVVDPAVVPDRRSFPKFSIIVSAVTALWLLFAVFAVLLVEAVARTKRQPEDEARLRNIKAVWTLRFPRSLRR